MTPLKALAVTFAAAAVLAASLHAPPQLRAGAPAPVFGFKVQQVYPHDREAFTEGLEYVDGYLYEGTGLNGRSFIRQVELTSGKILRQRALANEHFGEGITIWKAQLFELTWRSQIAFVYDKATFQPRRTFSYSGEGWGLTHDSTSLIMSDGSNQLRYFDSDSFAVRRRLSVTDGDRPVMALNELEYIKGQVFANIWTTDRIARIDPQSGRVLGWLDLTGLLPAADRTNPDAVLNGIAYDAAGDRIFVTGKYWPKLFEIKVVPR